MTLQSVTPDDRVGDERVGSHDTAQKERGCGRIAQEGHSHDISQNQGHETGEESKQQEPLGVFLCALHVHLQSGQEHDVIKTYSSEELKGVVALEDIEAVLSDSDACQHHTDDVGDTQLTHHDRRKENDQQHHKKDECGVGDWQVGR